LSLKPKKSGGLEIIKNVISPIRSKREFPMSNAKPKRFNFSGPCDPEEHYALPISRRLPDVQPPLEYERYFAIRAPRQSGKTTVMKAEIDRINEEGLYYALYCSLEPRLREIDDSDEAMNVIVDALNKAMGDSKVTALKSLVSDGFLDSLNARLTKFSKVENWLMSLSEKLDKKLVVFFDDLGNLSYFPLGYFLAQIRDGFMIRSKIPFPSSMAFSGVSSVHAIESRQTPPDAETFGSGSPFNIIKETMSLSNFSLEEIKALYAQHTEATGQIFLEDAARRAFYWSQGQPLLVNALAAETLYEILAEDYRPEITGDLIDKAAANLIERRDANIDSLMAHLKEPWVKKVAEELARADSPRSIYSVKTPEILFSIHDYIRYCLDLGLLTRNGSLRPANPIYAFYLSKYLDK
jgi:hypothetical protein